MDEALEASDGGDTHALICAIAEELYSRLHACGFDVQNEKVTQMLGKMVELAPTFGAINDAFVEVAPSLKDASPNACEAFLESYVCHFVACVRDTTVEDLLWADEDSPHYPKLTSLSRPFDQVVRDLKAEVNGSAMSQDADEASAQAAVAVRAPLRSHGSYRRTPSMWPKRGGVGRPLARHIITHHARHSHACTTQMLRTRSRHQHSRSRAAHPSSGCISG